MEWIAHRAANDVRLIAPSLSIADGVELDVHLFRGRLEVRHAKVLWPLRCYWERNAGIVGREQPPDLPAILAETPHDAPLWIDLKGFTSRLTRRVLAVTGKRTGMTMSSRSWWVLRRARRTGRVRTFRSVGSRVQLWIALRIDHPDGVGLPERFATEEVVERLRPRCAAIAVWGASDAGGVAELIALGVQILIVDDLDIVTARDRNSGAPNEPTTS